MTDRHAGTVLLSACLYEGSDALGEHVATASAESFTTVGDLMRWRNDWLNSLEELA